MHIMGQKMQPRRQKHLVVLHSIDVVALRLVELLLRHSVCVYLELAMCQVILLEQISQSREPFSFFSYCHTSHSQLNSYNISEALPSAATGKKQNTWCCNICFAW